MDITQNSTEEIAGSGLEIYTNPANVEVFIDGIRRGVTPFNTDILPPGDYSLMLRKDGYRDFMTEITIFRTSRLVVCIKMEQAEWD